MCRADIGLWVCFFTLAVAAEAGQIQPDIHAGALALNGGGYVNSSNAPAKSFDTLLFTGITYQMAESQGAEEQGAADAESPLESGGASETASDADESLNFFQSSPISSDFYAAADTQSAVRNQLTESDNSSSGVGALFDPGTASGGHAAEPGQDDKSEDSAIAAVASAASNLPTFLNPSAVDENAAAEDKNSELQTYASDPDSSSASAALHVPEPSTLLMLLVGVAAGQFQVCGNRRGKKSRSTREV